ncbi:MAG: hypothetical protein O3C21_12130 [Verrucomicrobia bacterium]|nr:hypothetical protein [Verrucomicrobiota bacterium]
MVNYYYFYCYDRNFGPFFIKYRSYFPYNGKLCINGHEWLKRQLALKRRAQRLADTLGAKQIVQLFKRWSRWLPHPFTAREQRDARATGTPSRCCRPSSP